MRGQWIISYDYFCCVIFLRMRFLYAYYKQVDLAVGNSAMQRQLVMVAHAHV